VGQRAKMLAVLLSYFVVTAVGFYFVSNHNEFVAIFGTFAVGAAAGVVFVAISLAAGLLRAIKDRRS